jgi:hypothetical protein
LKGHPAQTAGCPAKFVGAAFEFYFLILPIFLRDIACPFATETFA